MKPIIRQIVTVVLLAGVALLLTTGCPASLGLNKHSGDVQSAEDIAVASQ